jgi:hypothetical protein
VLQRIAERNPSIEIYVLHATGHNFGSRQSEGLDYAANWLLKTLA